MTIQDLAYLRTVTPDAFRFREDGQPCTYWSSGDHIVANHECRCGKKFTLVEQLPGFGR